MLENNNLDAPMGCALQHQVALIDTEESRHWKCVCHQEYQSEMANHSPCNLHYCFASSTNIPILVTVLAFVPWTTLETDDMWQAAPSALESSLGPGAISVLILYLSKGMVLQKSF